MKRLFSLCCGLAMVLSLAEAGNACTSIRVKTDDGLVFYARNMEGASTSAVAFMWFPKARPFRGPCRTIPPKD